MKYPGHYHVDSVAEAVALAEKFRVAGAFNLFRGQIVDWPMRATFCRLKSEEREAAQRRYVEFVSFIKRTPELSALHGDMFGTMAIAQHYGIPTVLVDFSTNPAVAGWFASHGTSSKDGRSSVIYLAHEEFVARHFRDRLEKLHMRRTNVDNLWRLQAQSGLFLHLPYPDEPALDEFLGEGFGSIRFPYRGPSNDIPESAIYPDRKSRLEILFDGFLTEERLRETHAGYRKLGLQVVPPPETEAPRPAPAFISGYAPPVHDSWNPDRNQAWLRPPPEDFRRQDNPPEIILEVDPVALKSPDPKLLPQQLAARIAQFLAANRDARLGYVNFRLLLSDSRISLDDRVHPDSRIERTVRQDLADCWDGMRRFPYSDAVICNALGYLAATWARVHANRQPLYSVLKELLGKNVLIEFGLAVGGQHASVPVPDAECLAAVRDDLSKLLKPDWHELRNAAAQLLHQVNEPARLFDFNRFVALFGQRFVPGQFLIRLRKVVLFTPSGIERLSGR